MAATICWKEKSTAKWKEKKVFLRKNKEILDTKLLAISKVLDITLKIANCRILITICSDFQKALEAITLFFTSEENQFVQSQMYQKMEKFWQTRYLITF